MTTKYDDFFIFDTKADAEVVGNIILLGITIFGIGMLSVFSFFSLSELKDMSNIKNSEQTFTILDSRASRVALGQSAVQTTGISLGGGEIFSLPNNSEYPSYFEIKRINSTSGVTTLTLPMGKIVYKLGDKEVAYEGGGVWSKRGTGSVLISPPEFHYNGETLTLPVMNVTSKTSIGGKGSASINIALTNSTVKYPTGGEKSNPVSGDKIHIIIHSDYYNAWASFANSSQYMRVATNLPGDGNNTANITLLVVQTSGTHPFIPPIKFRGINPDDADPLDFFSFNLTKPDKTDMSSFNMDLRAPSSGSTGPSPYLHLNFQKKGGLGQTGVIIVIEFGENGMKEIFDGEVRASIDGDTAYFDTLDSTYYSNYTSNDPSWTWNDMLDAPYNKIYDKNINKSGPPTSKVLQHYIRLMGNRYGGSFDMYGSSVSGEKGPTSNQWPGEGSEYTLIYDPLGGITYLHITSNNVNVSFS